ncbi:pirin [Opitutaceae bacterium TAV5]|nr:pirin [Opitutaceae bacterium TAV5]
MRIYLPDTNVFSRAMRKQDAALSERFIEAAPRICLSAVVWFELTYGAEKRPDLPVFQERLNLLREAIPETEPFDEEAAWHAARLRVYLETLKPNAQPVGHYDLLLAGHALSIGAILVTHNVREFVRVPGLVVEDWQTED